MLCVENEIASKFPTHYFIGHGGSKGLCRKLSENLVQVCCNDGITWNLIPLHIRSYNLYKLFCKIELESRKEKKNEEN